MAEFRISIGVILCCLVCCSDVSAQYNQEYSNPPRKKSAIEKLSELNEKLKSNLKQSLFGSDEAGDLQQDYQKQRGEYNQSAQYSQGRNASQRQPDDYRRARYDSPVQQGGQQRATQAQYQQELQNDWPPRQSAGSGTRGPQPGEVNPGAYRHPENERFDTPESYANQNTRPQIPNANVLRSPEVQHYGARSDMGYSLPPQQQPIGRQAVPQPAPAHANLPNRNDDYRAGHYQNGGMTQQQLDQQETATQRVLRLNSEMQSLVEAQRSTTAENKRLRAQLREKTALLKEIESTIYAARTELQKANQNNRMLNEQIAKVESEKAQQLRASTRQLNAIRKKLDDVLMLEMTSK